MATIDIKPKNVIATFDLTRIFGKLKLSVKDIKALMETLDDQYKEKSGKSLLVPDKTGRTDKD